uniref:Uncharacterized protein n=1 Tax=Clandestinovirus TaxID=2831644 RepID=A0A8F8PKB4_9VIRU|nr:hypothetical protein KOM_12_322 [Clandestinovirus]
MTSLLHSSLLNDTTTPTEKADDMIALKCIDGTIHLPRVEAKKVLGKYYKSFEAIATSYTSATVHIPTQVLLNAYSVYKDSGDNVKQSIENVDKHISLLEHGGYFGCDCGDALIPFSPMSLMPTRWGSSYETGIPMSDENYRPEISCVLKSWMPPLPEIIKDQIGDYWNSLSVSVIYNQGYESPALNITQIMDIYNIVNPKMTTNVIRRNSYLFLPLYLDVLFGAVSQVSTICVKTCHNPYPVNRQEHDQLLAEYDGPKIHIRFPNEQDYGALRELCTMERPTVSEFPVRIVPSEFNTRTPATMIERGVYQYEMQLPNQGNRYAGWNVAAKVVKMKSSDIPSSLLTLHYYDQTTHAVDFDDVRRTNWLWMPFISPDVTKHDDHAFLLIPSGVTKLSWTSSISRRIITSTYCMLAPVNQY